MLRTPMLDLVRLQKSDRLRLRGGKDRRGQWAAEHGAGVEVQADCSEDPARRSPTACGRAR